MNEKKRDRERRRQVARRKQKAREQAKQSEAEARLWRSYDGARRAQEHLDRGEIDAAVRAAARAAALNPGDPLIGRVYLAAATLIETDLERFVTPVRRRTREGTVAIYHRMADGKLEGPACAACGVATLSFYLCDDRLHVLCSSCGRSGRLDPARCRACRGQGMEPLRLSVVDATARLSIGAAEG